MLICNECNSPVEFVTLSILPVISRRKVRLRSRHHASYALGDARGQDLCRYKYDICMLCNRNVC
jgi:hypothetical protein